MRVFIPVTCTLRGGAVVTLTGGVLGGSQSSGRWRRSALNAMVGLAARWRVRTVWEITSRRGLTVAMLQQGPDLWTLTSSRARACYTTIAG